MQRHGLPLLQVWPYQSLLFLFFEPLVAGDRRPLWLVFLCSFSVVHCCLAHKAHRGASLAGVLLCRLVHQKLKGATWVGSSSVVSCIRHLMGQPLYCSAADAIAMWGDRGYGDGSTMCDSAVSPYFHGCLAFLHRHFPPQSPLSHPLGLSLHSKQQPSPWDCCTIPKLQLPAAAPSRGPASLLGGWYGCGKGSLSLIPFRLPQMSCFTLSLKCFSLTQKIAPMWGSDICFSSPTC